MEKYLRKAIEQSHFSDIASSFFAIIVGVLVGFIVLLISDSSQAMDGFVTILTGGFLDGSKSIGQVFYFATPIIMTGLSIAFSFKTGLFNIGAPGQLIVGAFAAVFIGVKWTWLPDGIHWFVALAAAGIMGGAWAFLPGVLKARFNVSEIISGISMNYIGVYLVNMLVVQTIYDSLKNRSLPVAGSAVIPQMGLDKIFEGSSVNAGIFVSVLFVIVTHIILNRTIFGYELKACGYNKDASKYAGINEKKNIILAITIAGVLAGIGGGLLYLSGAGKFIKVVDIIPIEGFNGIPVALLALSNPIGVLFSGLFIAYINVGGFYLQQYNFNKEIIDIITALIIYFSAFSMIFKQLIARCLKRKRTGGPGGN